LQELKETIETTLSKPLKKKLTLQEEDDKAIEWERKQIKRKLDAFIIKKNKCITYYPADQNEAGSKFVVLEIFYSHAKKGNNVDKFIEQLETYIVDELST